MTWIKLHKKTAPVWINMSAVVRIDAEETGSHLDFSDAGLYERVDENPDDIMAQCRGVEITPRVLEAGVLALDAQLENLGHRIPTMALEGLVVRVLQQALAEIPISIHWDQEIDLS